MLRRLFLLSLILRLLCAASAADFAATPSDSPTFVSFLQGKPLRVPADDGGGWLSVGFIAPPTFKLVPVKGTSLLRGEFELSDVAGPKLGDRVYVITRSSDRRVLALFVHGYMVRDGLEGGRIVETWPMAEMTWEEPPEAPIRSAILGTRIDRVLSLHYGKERHLLRAAPELKRLEKFPLYGNTVLSFDLERSAPSDVARPDGARAPGPAIVTVQPTFVTEAKDLPQTIAFIRGEPMPVPADAGGGFVQVGKPAPSGIKLERLPGSTWCRGVLLLPPVHEVAPPTEFRVFAREPEGPVEAILFGGFTAILLAERERVPSGDVAGLAVYVRPGGKSVESTLVKTGFTGLLILKGESFDWFIRHGPGAEKFEPLPLTEEVSLRLKFGHDAKAWASAQEPLLASLWEKPGAPDWEGLEQILAEASLKLGSREKALALVTAPGLRLWGAPLAARATGAPGRALLRKFAADAAKEPVPLEMYREIHAFSQVYPPMRPAGPLAEKLLARYEKMTVTELLDHRYAAAKEPTALTALRHARRIDSPEATEADYRELRFLLPHVVPPSEIASILPPADRLWLAQAARDPSQAAWVRQARLALGVFPTADLEVRWAVTTFAAPSPSEFRRAVAALLEALPEGELAPPDAGAVTDLPFVSLTRIVAQLEQVPARPQPDLASELRMLLWRARGRPYLEQLQDLMLTDLPDDLVVATALICAKYGEAERLRAACVRRLRELEDVAAREGRQATAAALTMNQCALLRLSPPTGIVVVSQVPAKLSDNPWERARGYLGKLVPRLFPPLDTSVEEGPAVFRVLESSYALSYVPAFQDLGLSWGPLADYVKVTHAAQGGPSASVRLTWGKLGFEPAATTLASPWTGFENAEVSAAYSRLSRAREEAAKIGKPNEFLSRFYGTDSLQQSLARVRAELAQARSAADGFRPNVDREAAQLSAYASEKAKLERDGVVVGNPPGRTDVAYTRELSSFDRRRIDLEMDAQKSRLESERQHQRYLDGNVAGLLAQERELVATISNYQRIATRSTAADVNSTRQDLQEAEAAYARAQGRAKSQADGGGAPVRNSVRVQALLSFRDRAIQDLQSVTGDTAAELFWRRWWLTSDPGPLPASLGGAGIPERVPRVESAERVWRHEFALALADPDEVRASENFVNGVWAIAWAMDARPALKAELKAAVNAQIRKNYGVIKESFKRARTFGDQTASRLLEELGR